MKVLLLGSGGREHALAWKIAQSPQLEKLFIAPGNAGTQQVGENIAISVTDFEAIKKLVIEEKIAMVIVGSEDPLVKGIVNFFAGDGDLKNILVIGPDEQGAQLEGSKDFSKEFMARNNIPSAAYKTFNSENLEEGKQFLETLQPPYVLKADGLAAGKGVLILHSLEEAKIALQSMIEDKQFGEASSKVVIEEFLDGIELSVFVLTDGDSYKVLPEAKDYKRIGEGDTGLNTGGMGAISPVPFAGKGFLAKVEEQVVKPTIEGLKKEGINYKGFLFIGLMNIKGEPFVVEYNVRMGDPETEVVIPRIKSDLLDLFNGVANKTLNEKTFETDERTATAVMLVSGGYPEEYEKGKEITGLEKASDSLLFHAGTREDNGKVITTGGRVLAITSYGNSMDEALKKSFKNAEMIDFDKKYYRKDIGFDLK